MAMAARVVPRGTAPHLPTLASTLTPLLAVANAGGFTLRYDTGKVVIEQASFSGVDTVAVDAAVAAAPAATPQLDAQAWVDALPIEMKAIVLTLLDEINILRTHAAIGLAARTPTQAVNAIRAKAGTL